MAIGAHAGTHQHDLGSIGLAFIFKRHELLYLVQYASVRGNLKGQKIENRRSMLPAYNIGASMYTTWQYHILGEHPTFTPSTE